MKDFANRKTAQKVKNKSRRTFSSKRPDADVISNSTIFYLLLVSFCLAAMSFFYFKTEISSIKPETAANSVTINFPTSLMDDSILIEEEEDYLEFGEDFEVPDEPVIVEREADKEEAKEEVPQEIRKEEEPPQEVQKKN